MSSKLIKNFTTSRQQFVWTLLKIHLEWWKTSTEIVLFPIRIILISFMLILISEIYAKKNLKFEEIHQETVETHL